MAKIGFLSHAGSSMYLFRRAIMKSLKDRGHEVFAIVPPSKYDKLINSEFTLVNYELDRASLNPFKVYKNFKKLSEILGCLNLDMIQTSAHKSNIFGVFASKKVGVKYIFTLVEGLGSFYVDHDFKSKFIRFVIEKLYFLSFKISHCCIFVNKHDCDFMILNNIINKDKAFIVKSVGIDSVKFKPSKFSCADKKIVLMISRALWHKGIAEFYKASEILKDRADCEFVFVGGCDENKSSAGLEFLEGKRVKYLGELGDVREILRKAYILVLPSYMEGFPRTILEAMSMGKAVVATDVVGCNEAVVDKKTGLLCSVRDPQDLALKISKLLDDEDLCKKMGEDARVMVERLYDEKFVAKKYIEIYRNFIDV